MLADHLLTYRRCKLVSPRGWAPQVLAPRGFTLIEILIVVGIIVLLSLLLLAALRHARDTARAAQCASNMRHIGLAMRQYADDNRGYFPTTTQVTGANVQAAWIFQLGRYLSNIDEVRICPADPLAERRLAGKGTSYIMNDYVAVPGVDEGRQIEKIRNPGRTITVFIRNDKGGFSAYGDHAHSRHWFSAGAAGAWGKFIADCAPDRHFSQGAADRSRGSANYLYADGHVELLEAGVIKVLADGGTNFAKPQ